MPSETIEHPDRLVVYPSRWKATLVLLGAMAFVALGFWIGSPGMASRVGPVERFIAFYVGVPFFGACGLYALVRLIVRRPALVIDSSGITDTSNPFGAGYLRWYEVDRVRLYQFQGQPFLGIFPRDLDLFLSRQNAARRTYVKMNLALGCAPLNLSQTVLPMKVAALAELLESRHGVRVEREGTLE